MRFRFRRHGSRFFSLPAFGELRVRAVLSVRTGPCLHLPYRAYLIARVGPLHPIHLVAHLRPVLEQPSRGGVAKQLTGSSLSSAFLFSHSMQLYHWHNISGDTPSPPHAFKTLVHFALRQLSRILYSLICVSRASSNAMICALIAAADAGYTRTGWSQEKRGTTLFVEVGPASRPSSPYGPIRLEIEEEEERVVGMIRGET